MRRWCYVLILYFVLISTASSEELSSWPIVDGLYVTPWETQSVDLERERWGHQSRQYVWLENGLVVRTCRESQFGPISLFGDTMLQSHHAIMGIDCDFLAYGDKGWEIAPDAARSRAAYISRHRPSWY